MTKYESAELAVTLAGTRDYVQGTQILARAAEAMKMQGTWTLTGAVFRKLTDRRVAIGVPLEAPKGIGPIGSANFMKAGGEIVIHFYELAGMAPRKHHFRLPNLAPTRVDTGFCGEFSFSDVTTLEDLLNVMVQATKQVHQTSRPDAREIMFTGMVDGEVPLSPTMIPSAGRLTVEHARLISRDSQFQTVSRVGITAHHLDDITAALSFSYNASRESYAT